MLEPKSTSPPYITSQESTPGIEVDPGSESVIRIKVRGKYDEEIVEEFKLLKTRMDTLERQNNDLNEMIMSNNKRYESLATEISNAITNHARWIENFRKLLTILNGQYDKKNRVINLSHKDDNFWIPWNIALKGEIIHDISEV
jgi:FtsZ-binding cell division protein ZapB